ncbi:hypothetical protein ABN028_17130 [Actinopolymorpha sp. B17G11]|uniref:hypothetical protein n=1 Tax=unclassified Actinopolymorpha TaxID=2627063 RepID=UPI0032D97EC8
MSKRSDSGALRWLTMLTPSRWVEGMLAVRHARFKFLEHGRAVAEGMNVWSAGDIHALLNERFDLIEQTSVDGRRRGRQCAYVRSLDLYLVGEDQVVGREAGLSGCRTEDDDASGEGLGHGQAGREGDR